MTHQLRSLRGRAICLAKLLSKQIGLKQSSQDKNWLPLKERFITAAQAQTLNKMIGPVMVPDADTDAMVPFPPKDKTSRQAAAHLVLQGNAR